MSEINEELIIKYLNNELSEQEEKLLLLWLQESENNREIFLTCKKIFASGKVRYYSNPLILDLALNKFNNRTETIQKQQNRKLFIGLSKYAALAIIILAISYLTWNLVRKDVKYNTVTVGRSESVKKMVLPDGTLVWINNNSSLTYPELFDSDLRTVTLSGEAFFEVKTDSLHPFIVKAGSMKVKVFGTSFNVNTNTNDNTVKTTLVTGKVTISDLADRTFFMLLPGQLANFHKNSQNLEVHQVNTDLYTSWRNGLVIFDKANLAEITHKIEEIYNIQITLNSKKKLLNKINFVFRKTQKLDTVMEMLEFVAPIEYKKFDNQIYINSK